MGHGLHFISMGFSGMRGAGQNFIVRNPAQSLLLSMYIYSSFEKSQPDDYKSMTNYTACKEFSVCTQVRVHHCFMAVPVKCSELYKLEML